MARRRVTLNRTQAERAIYIDFEGTAVDPPSLLGATWMTEPGIVFAQYVLEEDLWPAAEAKSPESGGFCEPATWASLRELRVLAEEEDRVLVAWSQHERDELAASMPDDGEWFASHVINAIPIAKAWARAHHPQVQFEKAAIGPLRGRHQLHRYLELIGYDVPKAFGPGNSAQRIRYVREMLARKDGEWSQLTPTAKGKWTRALEHNWHDRTATRSTTSGHSVAGWQKIFASRGQVSRAFTTTGPLESGRRSR